MRTIRFLSALLVMSSFAPPSSAHDESEPSHIATAVHQTAGNLRRKWDAVRTKDAQAAACLEGKVLQAISLARRADEHLRALETNETKDAAERARRTEALRRIAERRGELWTEALACEGNVFAPVTTTAGVTVQVSGNIAPVDPQPGGFPFTFWSALLHAW